MALALALALTLFFSFFSRGLGGKPPRETKTENPKPMLMPTLKIGLSKYTNIRLNSRPFIKGEVHQRVRPGVRPDVRPGVWPDVRPDVRAAPVSSEGGKKNAGGPGGGSPPAKPVKGGVWDGKAPPAKIRGVWGAAPPS